MSFGLSNCYLKIQQFIRIAFSAQTFPCPCLGCEPKAKVMTIIKKLFHFLDNFFFGFVIPYQVYSQLKFILDFQDFGSVGGWGSCLSLPS
jgi:hypothetical protein